MRDREGRLSLSSEVSAFACCQALLSSFLHFSIPIFLFNSQSTAKVPSEEQSRTKFNKKPEAGKRGCSYQNVCLCRAYGIARCFPHSCPLLSSAYHPGRWDCSEEHSCKIFSLFFPKIPTCTSTRISCLRKSSAHHSE